MAEGYKDWSAGDILTAADLEDYTVKQSVMVFADASARTTALTSVLREGMVSYLKDTDSTEVYDGSAWAALGGGKILQVVSTTKTDTFSASVGGSTQTAITGLTATITPSDTANKVLVIASVNAAFSTEYASAMLLLTRGGAGISLGDTAGSRTSITGGTVARLTNNADTALSTIHYLDTPSSTSALTYGINIHNVAGSTRTVYVNRTAVDTDDAKLTRSTSTITVMEVSA